MDPARKTELDAAENIRAIILDVWRTNFFGAEISDADNFFELGGSSVQGVDMIFEIEERVGIDLSLELLFDHPRLGQFAEAVLKARGLLERPAGSEKGLL